MSARSVCSGNLALNLFLGAGNFRSTQASADHDADALRVGAHGFLYGLLHGTAERDTLLQLLRDAAGHQVGIQFRLADLHDVQPDALLGLFLKSRAQLINLFAALADHDTGSGRVNRDRDLVRGGTLDLSTRNRGVRQLFAGSSCAA